MDRYCKMVVKFNQPKPVDCQGLKIGPLPINVLDAEHIAIHPWSDAVLDILELCCCSQCCTCGG